jgi:hypothetical protein
MDLLHHGIELHQNFVIPEAKHPEPSALEEPAPSQIFFEPLGMLASVELDNKQPLRTTEIGYERWNRMLSAKLEASALPST